MKTSLPGHGKSRLLQWLQMGEIYVVAAGLKLEDAAGQVINSAARDLRAIEQQLQTAELRLMLRQIEIGGQRFVGHSANFAAGDLQAAAGLRIIQCARALQLHSCRPSHGIVAARQPLQFFQGDIIDFEPSDKWRKAIELVFPQIGGSGKCCRCAAACQVAVAHCELRGRNLEIGSHLCDRDGLRWRRGGC